MPLSTSPGFRYNSLTRTEADGTVAAATAADEAETEGQVGVRGEGWNDGEGRIIINPVPRCYWRCQCQCDENYVVLTETDLVTQ